MKETENPLRDEERQHVGLPSDSHNQQFGILALFWVTFIFGLGVAYLQRFDSLDILWGGMLSILIGLIVGLVIGWISGKTRDSVFWATLIAAFAYMSVASDPNYDSRQRLAWAVLGAFAGSLASTVFTKRPVLNAFVCALSAGLVMVAYCLLSQRQTTDVKFDMIVAPFIGIAIASFVRMLMWLEIQRKMPRYVTATWLLIVVILGNVFSR